MAPKQFHDVVGYYNRFDVFKLTVDRTANRPVHFLDEPDDAARLHELGNGKDREDANSLSVEIAMR